MHLIRFTITAIIESEIFPNIRPQEERINKKVNPFLNKRLRQGVCNTEFSDAGKGEYEVCASNERNIDARGRENMKCVLEKIGKKESAEKG